jgi:hypothetical protein
VSTPDPSNGGDDRQRTRTELEMEGGRKALERRLRAIFGPNKTRDAAPVVRSIVTSRSAPMAKLPPSQARWKS